MSKKERRFAIVIGLGEVGHVLYRMLLEAYGVNRIKGRDVKAPKWRDYHFTFMHVCFPQTINFLTQLEAYIQEYDPRYVIIHSTLSPGMTKTLTEKFPKWRDPDQQLHQVGIFYSPVRGNTKDGMEWCLKTYTKYIAGLDSPLGTLYQAAKHLGDAGFKVKALEQDHEALALEQAKLWDLAWYGLNIVFYQELERVCRGKTYSVVREFIESTPVESQGKVPRVVFYGGHIGGHCVIPAAEKLYADTRNPLFRHIIESNIRREQELLKEKPDHHPP